ncbi:MAG: carboxypeptidase regulatory-like domain-containing protein [Eggerthellaceae bacterium]|nr:carboxypeptidase regulatory-like domain-containing protein [Eggerthellaceae bacterium]
MKVFLFDVDKCNGCRNCQVACKDEHCGTDWPAYAKAQPDTGQFWLKVDEQIRGQVPKVKISYTLRFCQHCGNAPCAEVCSENAFVRRQDGLLILDYEKCNGCMDCVEACPFGSIFANEELGIAQKCTGCAHLLDDGHELPHCVDVCPHDAFLFKEMDELIDDLIQAEFLYDRSDLDPRVFYLNLPKRFIAGTVVDPEIDEVLIGVSVTLENVETGEVEATKSDEFGDFWFKKVDPAFYRLYFEQEGYMTRVLEVETMEKDRNIDFVELYADVFE